VADVNGDGMAEIIAAAILRNRCFAGISALWAFFCRYLPLS